jgi:group I intron endonuclease
MQVSGIYKIYWENNEYFYVGKSKDIRTRKRSHINCLKKNNHKNRFIQRVYNKYGLPIIKILCEVPKNDLQSVEQFYLDVFVGNKNCLNIAKNSDSNLGTPMSEEAKKKLSIRTKERLKIYNPSKGRKMSEEQRKRQSENLNKIYEFKRSVKATQKVLDVEKQICYLSIKLFCKETGLKEAYMRSVFYKGIINKTPYRLINEDGSIDEGKVVFKNRKEVVNIITGEKYLSIDECAKKNGFTVSGLYNQLKRAKINTTNFRIINDYYKPPAKIMFDTECGIFYNSINEMCRLLKLHKDTVGKHISEKGFYKKYIAV